MGLMRTNTESIDSDLRSRLVVLREHGDTRREQQDREDPCMSHGIPLERFQSIRSHIGIMEGGIFLRKMPLNVHGSWVLQLWNRCSLKNTHYRPVGLRDFRQESALYQEGAKEGMNRRMLQLCQSRRVGARRENRRGKISCDIVRCTKYYCAVIGNTRKALDRR